MSPKKSASHPPYAINHGTIIITNVVKIQKEFNNVHVYREHLYS